MNDLLQWSELFARNSARDEQKGRDLLTESIGQSKAAQSGASFLDTVDAGGRYLQTSKDPLYDLKKMQLQSSINENVAQAADHFRGLAMKDQQTKLSQEDNQAIAHATLQANGNTDDLLKNLFQISPKSPAGETALHQKIGDLISYKNKLQTSKLETGMTDGLNKMVAKNDDPELAKEAAMLNFDYQQTGWDRENTAKYYELQSKVNAKLATSRGYAGHSTQNIADLEMAAKYEAAGKTSEAALLRAGVEKRVKEATFVAGTLKQTDLNTGDVVTRKLTENQLGQVPVILNKDQKTLMDAYKASKDDLDAGHDNNWGGLVKSNSEVIKENGAKLRLMGIDPDTGLRINASPVVEIIKPKTSSPYKDGTLLKGPDGKTYIVKDGVPVLQ